MSITEIISIAEKVAIVFGALAGPFILVRRWWKRVWTRLEHLERIPEIQTDLKIHGIKIEGLLENGSYASFVCDSHGRNLKVNGNFCRLVGATTEELMDYEWRNFITPKELARYDAVWKPAMEEHRDYSGDLVLTHKDKFPVPVTIRVQEIPDKDGTTIAYCGLIRKKEHLSLDPVPERV